MSKTFWTYTAARLGIFAAVYAVIFVVGSFVFELSTLTNLFVLLVALVISSVISIFALSGLRNRLAAEIQSRAERMSARIEESRSAEDVD